MTTVLALITDSLQDAGIIADTETPSASMGQKAFRLLNRMLDSWSTEDLMIYNNVQEVFPFIGGTQTYTIGAGGNFNTSRPINITNALVRDTNNNDLTITIWDYEEYSNIISKAITATIPLGVYYNAAYPLSTLSFWPVPQDTSYRFVLWSWKVLSSFTNINEDISFPPGYEDAIESNLAARCCAAFNRPLTQELAIWANESKAQIKRINVNVPELVMPSAIRGGNESTTFPISPSILTGY